ncbi:hypothetical protein [Altererythrobacter sp. ZODW24]|uniref:hypothetical protein n=1 Tax=Altererythrobacter sp. ZODW24 TaxID=2185142 RepID=UPI0013B36401|nr:hypothetical protein [Altererythrobacter sp. ZODW24]
MPPDNATLHAYLIDQASFPNACETSSIRVFHEEIGDLQSDYSSIYNVNMDEKCAREWQTALDLNTTDYLCSSDLAECSRSHNTGMDGLARSRFKEEFAAIRFWGDGFVQVQVTKI